MSTDRKSQPNCGAHATFLGGSFWLLFLILILILISFVQPVIRRNYLNLNRRIVLMIPGLVKSNLATGCNKEIGSRIKITITIRSGYPKK